MSEAILPVDETSGQLALALPGSQEIAVPRLRIGDRIERYGVILEYKAKVPGGKKFVRLDTGADDIVVTNMTLLEEMERRIIRLASPAWLNEPRSKQWALTFEARSATEQRLAHWRMAYVKAFEENSRLGYPVKVGQLLAKVHRSRMADPANVAAGEEPPSLAAVYGWLEEWGKAEIKSVKVLCFAESRRGPREPRLDDAVKLLLRDAIRELWYTAERKRVRVVWDRLVSSAIKQGIPENRVPCQRTVRRLIAKLPPYAVAKARRGKRAADLKYRSVGQMVEAAFPGEVYEVDAHRLNWMAVDGEKWPIGRLWVTVVIDRCTRCIVGLHVHVEPPCSLTIAAALRNAFAPKLYMLRRWPAIGRGWPCWGLPTLVILDNGLENKATFLTEALLELGVAWRWAEPRVPEEKPYIERWFGTMDSDLAIRIPGWTGANPQEKGDYDAVGMSCITEEQSDELIHRYVIAYNISTHAGVRGIPEQLWREETELEVTPIEDLGMLDVLLGDYAIRTLRRTGIELLGLRFGDKGEYRPLEFIRTRAGAGETISVRVRFDRNDLSLIHVQDPLTKEYFPVSSLDLEYTQGLTLARHRIIRRRATERAKGYVTIGELCTARDDLQRRIDEMTGAEPMTERRFATVFNGLGSKGSWGEFYRLADEEYGKTRKDTRSIVDLIETEDGWAEPVQGGIAPVLRRDMDASPAATAAPTPAAEEPEPAAAEDLATKLKRLGMD